MTRAEASVSELKDLNPGVIVDIAKKATIEHMYTFLQFSVANYNCVVVLDHYDREYLVKLNKAAR